MIAMVNHAKNFHIRRNTIWKTTYRIAMDPNREGVLQIGHVRTGLELVTVTPNGQNIRTVSLMLTLINLSKKLVTLHAVTCHVVKIGGYLISIREIIPLI